MATLPQSASKHYRLSALIARRAVREAQAARKRGDRAGVIAAVVSHQIASARESEQAVTAILDEQAIPSTSDAPLALAGFAVEPRRIEAMSNSAATDLAFARLVQSLVQDSGNAAEQVTVATRRDVGWVRHLTPPSCSRCVPLAGRVYRYSDGFLRHPGDDCVTLPVRAGDASFAVDPVEMVRTGQVSGLSEADREAVLDGADLGQVVNVRRKSAGLSEAGEVLARAGRPTPAGIYRMSSSRDEALGLLQRFGYIL